MNAAGGLAMNILLGCGLHLFVLLAPLLLVSDPLGRLASPTVLAFVALATLFFLAECSQTARRSSTPRFCFVAQEKLTGQLALGTGLLLLAIFWVGLGQGSIPKTFGGISLVCGGGLLLLAGIALRYLAMRTLGDYFVSETAVQAGQRVIRHGIYRRLRHPSETGTLLIAFGAALLLQSLLALAIAGAALLPLVVVRIALEECGLQAAFGCEYMQYMQSTPRLIPRVY
jgi:protein-S-isoprenylcysteine O-methyltransferase Ste14